MDQIVWRSRLLLVVGCWFAAPRAFAQGAAFIEKTFTKQLSEQEHSSGTYKKF